ncbi:MAG: type II secretion system protein [Planctomycetota bacterium]|nr:MAG: type II secretion system protein [Planctomycetota bacterium]
MLSLRTFSTRRQRISRTGFSLVELLVSITIFIILATISLSAFRDSKHDKVAAAARQLGASFHGAHSRAGKSMEPRGLRLLRDKQTPALISGMQYIGQTQIYDGTLRVQIDANGTVQLKCIQLGEWTRLRDEGLLKPGARMRIPANESGRWYTISSQGFDPDNNKMRIVGLIDNASWNPAANSNLGAYQIEPRTSADPAELTRSNTLPIPYLLRLAPQELPETEATNLPPGIVIDLDSSRMPQAWKVFEDTNQNGVLDANENDGNATLPNDNANGILDDVNFDILVSPNGTVTGSLSGSGPIFLYVCTREDFDRMQSISGYSVGLIPGDFENGQNGTVAPYTADFPSSERKLVCIIPQTGLVYMAEVNGTDNYINGTSTNTPDGWADDPYSYARKGREGR